MPSVSAPQINIAQSIRELAQSDKPLNEDNMQKAVDYVNSGKHPKFPGAKQRVNLDQLRQATKLINKSLKDPNSQASKGLNVLEERSKVFQDKITSVKKDLLKGDLLSKLKARVKAFLAQISFKKGIDKDLKAIKTA